jgi:hypothetical protein
MAVVPYEVTVEDGLRMVGALPSPTGAPVLRAGDDPPPADDPRPFLGTHNLVRDLVTVGCFDCEQPLTPATAHSPCPGEPSPSAVPTTELGRVGPGTLSRVGRNDPCPCGSGQKFKRCHGARS